ncbi:MAG: hypothetical protein ACP5U1_13635 [Desulfomonilaceae bacterium]
MDITESEKRYRAVIDNLHIGISVINHKMEIVAVKPFFTAIFPHVHSGEGQTCYSTHNDPPRSSPSSYCPCMLSFADGEARECETETSAGHQIRNHRIISCPIKDESGKVELVSELLKDIAGKNPYTSNLRRLRRWRL